MQKSQLFPESMTKSRSLWNIRLQNLGYQRDATRTLGLREDNLRFLEVFEKTIVID